MYGKSLYMQGFLLSLIDTIKVFDFFEAVESDYGAFTIILLAIKNKEILNKNNE